MIVKSSLIREINNSQFVLLILEYINIYNIFLFQTIRSFDHNVKLHGKINIFIFFFNLLSHQKLRKMQENTSFRWNK